MQHLGVAQRGLFIDLAGDAPSRREINEDGLTRFHCCSLALRRPSLPFSVAAGFVSAGVVTTGVAGFVSAGAAVTTGVDDNGNGGAAFPL